MRSIMRRAAGAVVAILMAVGIGVGIAAPAQASDYWDSEPANITGACRDEGHYGAWFGSFWNPYSWYCYDASYSFSLQDIGVSFGYAGPIDVNAWCQKQYGGAFIATVVENNTDGWRCVLPK